MGATEFPFSDIFVACMQAKIQKHQAFEAEVAAHENSIASFQNTGKTMISHGHFASEAIQVREESCVYATCPTWDPLCAGQAG